MTHRDTTVPALRFHMGWRLLYLRLKFMFGWGIHLFDRRRFPLFRIWPLRSGALYTVKIARDIGIRKMAQFGDIYFSSLTSPHHPSPAYARMLARGGLNVGAAGTPLKQQIDTVLMAITRQCDLHCQHCYERHNVGTGDDLPLERLQKVVAQVQQHGASVLVLTGGEPMNRFDDLLAIVRGADKHLSDIHVHTSGHGVTAGRAAALKEAGVMAAAVGLDDVEKETHDQLRGFKGSYDDAVRALRTFRETGIFTYVNVCATPRLVRSGGIWRYAEFVRDLGVGYIQLLEPRPCGGYLNAPPDVLLTPGDRDELVRFFRDVNGKKRYSTYPMVHYVAYAESPAQRGCMMGGLSHLYIDGRGNVNPCVFLPVTFGNIMDEDFETIYARMRKAIPRPLHAECPSLQLQPILKEVSQANGGMPVPHGAVAREWHAMYMDQRTSTERPAQEATR